MSPIEYGHVLLVPRLLDCLPQRIQADTLLLALHMAVEVDNPYLRIGYNSLGAFATINHLHYQVTAIPANSSGHGREVVWFSSEFCVLCHRPTT